MFEAIVGDALEQVIGKYVDGVDAKHFKMSLLSGNIELTDLRLKPDALSTLGPFTVTNGVVGRIVCKVPWTHLKSQPVVVIIEDVVVTVKPRPIPTRDAVAQVTATKVATILDADDQSRRERLAGKASQESASQRLSMISRLVTKIVNNLQVEIKNVHIRYDNTAASAVRQSCGLRLETLTVKSCASDWRECFVENATTMFKLVGVDGLSAYWMDGSDSVDSASAAPDTEIDWHSVEGRRAAGSKLSDAIGPNHRILMPLSCSLRLTVHKSTEFLDGTTPKVCACADVRDISLALSNTQVKGINAVVSAIALQKAREQAPLDRPSVKIIGNTKVWWQYVLSSCRCTVQSRRATLRWEHMRSSWHRNKEYLDLYKRSLQNDVIADAPPLSQQENQRIAAIEDATTCQQIPSLLAMRSVALKIVARSLAQGAKPVEQRQLQKKSVFGWLWSGRKGKPDKDINARVDDLSLQLTDEQLAAVRDILEIDRDEDLGTGTGAASTANDTSPLLQVTVTLSTSSLTLFDAHREVIALMGGMGRTTVNIANFASWTIQTSLASFEVRDLCTSDTAFPLVLQRPPAKDSADPLPLLKASLAMPSVESSADISLRVALQPTELVVSVPLLQSVLQWVAGTGAQTSAATSMIRKRIGVAASSYANRVRSRVADAVTSHRTLDIGLNLRAPTILVPSSVESSRPNSDMLVFDFGSLDLKTVLATAEERSRAASEAAQRSQGGDGGQGSSPTVLAPGLYDTYQLKLSGLRVIAAERKWRGWRQASSNNDGDDDMVAVGGECIVHRVDMSLDLCTAIVRNVCGVTLVSMTADLPRLAVFISQRNVSRAFNVSRALVSIASLLTNKGNSGNDGGELLDGSAQNRRQTRTFESTYGPEHVAAVTGALLPQRTATTPLSPQGGAQKDLLRGKPLDQAALSWRQLEGCFSIGMLVVTLSHETVAGEQPLLRLTASSTKAQWANRPRDASLTLSLGDLSVEDCRMALGSEYAYLFTSTRDRAPAAAAINRARQDSNIQIEELETVGKDDQLVVLNVTATRRDHPAYAGDDILADINFGTVFIGANLDTIAELGHVADYIRKQIRALRYSWRKLGDASKMSVDEGRTMSPVSPMSPMGTASMGPSTTPNAEQNSTAKRALRVSAALSSISVALFSERANVAYPVAALTLGATQCALEMAPARSVVASGELGVITVLDLTPSGSLHRCVFQTLPDAASGAAAAATFRVRTFPNAQSSSYPGHDAEGEITLSPFRCVLIARFTAELRTYWTESALHLQHRHRIASAVAKARAKAKDRAARAAKSSAIVVIGIQWGTSTFVVPRNSFSRDALIGYLSASVSNTVEHRQGVAGADDAVDHTEVLIPEFKFCTDVDGTESTIGTVSLQSKISRHLFPHRCAPGNPIVDIDVTVTELTLNLDERAVSLLDGIVRGNVREGQRVNLAAYGVGSSQRNITDGSWAAAGRDINVQTDEVGNQSPLPLGAPAVVVHGDAIGVVHTEMKARCRCSRVAIALVKAADPDLCEDEEIIARATFESIGVSGERCSDGSAVLSLQMGALSVVDTRSSSSNVFKELVETRVVDGETRQQLDVAINWPTGRGARTVRATVSPLRVILVAEPLVAIGRFVQQQLGGVSDAKGGHADERFLPQNVAPSSSDARNVSIAASTASAIASRAPRKILPMRRRPGRTEGGQVARGEQGSIRIDRIEITLIEECTSKESRRATLEFGAISTWEETRGDHPIDTLTTSLEDFTLRFYSPTNNKDAQNVIEPITASVDYTCEWDEDCETLETVAVSVTKMIEITVTYQDITMLRNVLQDVQAALHPPSLDYESDEDSVPPETTSSHVSNGNTTKQLPTQPTNATATLDNNGNTKPTDSKQIAPGYDIGISKLDTVVNVTCAGIALCVVNDCVGWNIPFCEVRLDQLVCSSEWYKSGAFKSTMGLASAVDLFNAKHLAWEPVVENFPVTCNITRMAGPLGQIDGPTGPMSVTVNAQQRLEVNIFETHLCNTIRTIEAWTSDWNSTGESNVTTQDRHRSAHRFWPYRLRNESGVAVAFVLDGVDDHEPRHVPIGGEDSFCFPGTARELRQSGHDTAAVKRTITVEFEGCGEPLQGLPVDAVGVHMVLVAGMRLVVEVTMDGSAKVIALQSAVKVYNKTNFPMELMIHRVGDASTALWQDTTHRDDHACVPLHLARGESISLRVRPFTGAEFSWSSSVQIPEFSNEKHAFSMVKCGLDSGAQVCFRLRFDCQAAVTRHGTAAAGGKEHVRVVMSIHPPLRIENRLPCRLSVRALAGSERNFDVGSGDVPDGGSWHVYGADLSKPVYISPSLPQFAAAKESVCVYDPAGRERSKELADKIAMVEDGAGQDAAPLILEIEHSVTDWGEHVVSIFASYWIVNRSGLPLKIGQDAVSGVKQAAGREMLPPPPPSLGPVQPFMFSYADFDLFGSKACLQVGPSDWSQPFSLEGLGTTGAVAIKGPSVVPGPRPRYELGIQLVLGSGRFQRTKICTVDPRFVLVNHTNTAIMYCQEGAEEMEGLGRLGDAGGGQLGSGGSTPFHWGDDGLPSRLRFKIPRDGENGDAGRETMWSGGVPIDVVGHSPVQLWHIDTADNVTGTACHLLVEVRQVHSTAMVILSWEDEVSPIYAIENNSDTPIKVSQKGQDRSRVVAPQSRIPFCLDAPTSAPIVMLDVWGDCSRYKECEIGVLGSHGSVAGPASPLYANVVASGLTKVLTVSSQSPDTAVDETLDAVSPSATETATAKSPQSTLLPRMAFSLTAAGLGVSVIDGAPRELVYVSVTGARIDVKDHAHEASLEVKLQGVQIDNQTPIGCPQVFAPLGKVKDRPFVHLAAVRSKGHKSMMFFQYFSVALQEMQFALHETLVVSLLQSLQNVIDQSSLPTDTQPAGQMEESGFAAVDIATSAALIPPSQRHSLYFELLHLHPIKVTVSFESSGALMDAGGDNGHGLSSNPVFASLRALRVAITSIDRAPLHLNALVLERPLVSREELVHNVAAHYGTQLIKEGYKILGSFELLGNPVGLVSNLGTGVMDFFYEPAQGAVRSPEEFAAGLQKGTMSLVRNSLYGTFNAVSKLTGSIGKGLANITKDEEYTKRRQQATAERPKHAGEGLKQGVEELGRGFWEGMSGIVKDPVKGAERGGASGFFEGVGKGLVGAAVKPVAGMFDMASKTAAGVRNTTDYIGGGDAAWRVRPPRVLSAGHRLRPYNARLALATSLLLRVRRGKYANDELVSFIEVNRDEAIFVTTQRVVLAVTKSAVQSADLDKKWTAPIRSIKTMSVRSSAAVLCVEQSHKKAKGGVLGAFKADLVNRVVECGSATAANLVVERIQSAARGEPGDLQQNDNTHESLEVQGTSALQRQSNVPSGELDVML